jgi:hypothetical protein
MPKSNTPRFVETGSFNALCTTNTDLKKIFLKITVSGTYIYYTQHHENCCFPAAIQAVYVNTRTVRSEI